MNICRFELNDIAQMSLDFLSGFFIFSLALISVFVTVPVIFSGLQASSIDLHPVAYRTSVILAEDPGYRVTDSSNGTDWENYVDYSNLSFIKRIGLAVSKDQPNVLDLSKIFALAKLYSLTNSSTIRDRIGLKTSFKDYSYNISLQRFKSTTAKPVFASDLSGKEVLLIGEPLPEREDVEKYERIIIYSSLSVNESLNISSTMRSNLNTPSTDIKTANATPRVGAFVVFIEGKNENQTESDPWMKIWIESDKVYETNANTTIGTHDLTNILNSYPSGIPVNIKFQIHNTKGYFVITNLGEYIGGRFGAKLVVYVW
jgi:hypothetical protein